MPKANAVREATFEPGSASSRRRPGDGSLAALGRAVATQVATSPAADDSQGAFAGVTGLGLLARLRSWLNRLTDAQLSFAISVVLFAVTAWPLMLVEVPPYQDLPNHLAAATIINHPQDYPEFVFNGFLKTNAALFTWLYFVGKVAGVKAAARLFAFLVLAVSALALPRFVLELTGNRRKMITASLLAWPSVHNWFVCMGMLDFALGVPLALVVIMLLNRQRVAPSLRLGGLIALASLATWYSHVFALLVVYLLVGLHLVQRVVETRGLRGVLAEARALVLPLVPSFVLVAESLYIHWTEPKGQMSGFLQLGSFIPPWEILYNLWAEWHWSFTWTTYVSIVPPALLLVFAYLGRRDSVPFFSPLALVALLGLVFFAPYVATNWFHVNSRFIPFFWMAAFVRVPERFPRFAPALTGLLLACAVVYSVGNGVDYVRLDADREKFTAGMQAIPEGSRMLPLVFNRKLTSENTRSLHHAWGFYVVEKRTSAPLLFAHSRSFPLMYKEPPEPRYNHLVLESFAPHMGNPDWMCAAELQSGVVGDCLAEWRRRWSEFWAETRPRYDHVLMWDATQEALAQVPPTYRVSFSRDRLTILERAEQSASSE
jgi:hypothetical protein